jgi:hypothetical protein
MAGCRGASKTQPASCARVHKTRARRPSKPGSMTHKSEPTDRHMKLCRRKPVMDKSQIRLADQLSPGLRILTPIATSRRSAVRDINDPIMVCSTLIDPISHRPDHIMPDYGYRKVNPCRVAPRTQKKGRRSGPFPVSFTRSQLRSWPSLPSRREVITRRAGPAPNGQKLPYCSLPTKPSLVTPARFTSASTSSTTT